MTEQREEERQSVRIAFYLTPTWAARLDDAVDAAGGKTTAGRGYAAWWNRHSKELTSTGPELSEDVMALQLELTESRAENRGLQALVDQMRERLGQADAHNQDLNRRLEEAHSTVDRVTLMLPAAGETERRWWKFLGSVKSSGCHGFTVLGRGGRPTGSPVPCLPLPLPCRG